MTTCRTMSPEDRERLARERQAEIDWLTAVAMGNPADVTHVQHLPPVQLADYSPPLDYALAEAWARFVLYGYGDNPHWIN